MVMKEFILIVDDDNRYLSREVGRIREEGFGGTMELRGDDELTWLCAAINEMSLQLREKEEREWIVNTFLNLSEVS